MKFGLGFVTIGIIPRALGPEMYGNYGFLTNFFSRTFKFCKLGDSSAYETKLSSTPTDYKLIGFYTIYILIVFLILLFSLCALGIFNKLEILFPGIEEKFVYLAFLLTFLQFVFTQITATHDATLLTLVSEKIVLFNSLTACLSIILLYYLNNINLNSILLLYLSITSICIFLGLISLFINKYF